MAINRSPVFPGTIKNTAVTFVTADGVTAKSLAVAGAEGTRIDSIVGTSTLTANATFTFSLNDGTSSYLLATFSLSALAGSATGGPSQKILDPVAFPWLDYSGSLWLAPGWSLEITPQSAVGAGQATFLTFSGDY